MNNDISNPRPIGDFISEQVLSTIYGLGLAIATWIVLPSIVFGAFNNSLLSALKTGAVFAGILMQVSHIPGVLEVCRKICLSTTIGYPAITHYVVIFNIDQALLFLIILGGVLAPTIKRVRRRKKSITSKKRGQSKGSTPDVKTVKAARADGFIPELNIQVGNFWLEPKFFNMHMLIAGSTGGGKSVLITVMLGTIRKRGERAVILDPGAAFMAKGYSPKGGDIIVSPYDARTHRWDPVSEIRRLPEARGLAEAIVPEGHGESGVWHEYARSFLSDIITSL
jgi:type IV secretory pathway TraG/TraD family ATPase VirD4